MAKGKYITEFERDFMRIGVAHGISAPQIARFLKRQKMVVYNHIKAMEADGTIENVPLAFVADEIAKAMQDTK